MSNIPDDPAMADPEDVENVVLMQIGDDDVPVLDSTIMQHWRQIDTEERFAALLAPEAIGHAHQGYPALVTGQFALPDRGDELQCVAPDGREFTGEYLGSTIEEGNIDVRFRVLSADPREEDDYTAGQKG